jgi:hypothetical protein
MKKCLVADPLDVNSIVKSLTVPFLGRSNQGCAEQQVIPFGCEGNATNDEKDDYKDDREMKGVAPSCTTSHSTLLDRPILSPQVGESCGLVKTAAPIKDLYARPHILVT